MQWITEFEFTATGRDGREIIVESQRLASNTSDIAGNVLSSPQHNIRLRTSDGMSVGYEQKGKYKIIQTGEIISSKDPHAP